MTPLIHPLHVAKMPFIWGNIVATPPGHYNSIRIYSLCCKNIEEGVCQGPFGKEGKMSTRRIHPRAWSMLPQKSPGPSDIESAAHLPKIIENKGYFRRSNFDLSSFFPVFVRSKNLTY
jgi:hypothetical protein